MKFLPSKNFLLFNNFLFLILTSQLTSSYHWDGNTLYDLESTTQTEFEAEAANWDLTLYRTLGLKISQCNKYILGGYCVLGGTGTTGTTKYYGQYFHKTYSSLPTHNQINIQLKIYIIDSWDGASADDHFEIGIDTNTVYGWKMEAHDAATAPTSFCGSPTAKDYPSFYVYLTYPHSGDTLLLKIISGLNEHSCNESLGFREIKIEFITASVPAQNLCGISSATLPSNPCPCPQTNMFMSPPNSGTCTSCDSNCATCANSAVHCTSCQPGWFLVGSTCYPTCDFPLYSTTSAQGVISCNTPCPGKFAYWDGSCSSTCTYPSNLPGQFAISPSTVNTFSLCNYPCETNKALASWNNSCLDSCPSLAKTITHHSRRFCDYYCAPGEYSFKSESCLVNNCPAGFWKNQEFRFCLPCQDSLCSKCDDASFGTTCQACKENSLLDSNNICQACTFLENEFLQYIDITNKYQYKLILYPTESCNLDETTFIKYLAPVSNPKIPQFTYKITKDADNFFLLELTFKSSILQDSTLNVTLSYLTTTLQVPMAPKPPETVSPALKTTFAAFSGGTLSAGLSLGATAALWSLLNFQQLIGYFAYMNIPYPPHLEAFLGMFLSANLEILPNPLESLMEKASEMWDSAVDKKEQMEIYQLPNKFKKLETPTLFIVNAGSTFLTCITLVFLPYMFDFLRKLKPLQNKKFIQKIHSSLRWNVPIRIFLESGIPLIFAMFIQIRKISYANIPYALSMIFATISFIYFYFMFQFVTRTLINLKHENLKNPNIEESIGTLYEGILMRKEKPYSKYYYLLVLLRGLLLVFVDVFAEDFPVAQITSMIVFNAFFMCFVFKAMEFESRYITWVNKIKEAIILVAEILMLGLYYQGNSGFYEDFLGWIIIALIGMILIMELVYGAYLQVLAIRGLIKKIANYCEKRKQKKSQKISPEIISTSKDQEASQDIILQDISQKDFV